MGMPTLPTSILSARIVKTIFISLKVLPLSMLFWIILRISILKWSTFFLLFSYKSNISSSLLIIFSHVFPILSMIVIVFSLWLDSALGPDGFSGVFFVHC